MINISVYSDENTDSLNVKLEAVKATKDEITMVIAAVIDSTGLFERFGTEGVKEIVTVAAGTAAEMMKDGEKHKVVTYPEAN